MPIQSNLSVSPYFDDYIYETDYYQVLFKPATAVQTRELNQLQTILKRQIEEFGDVVLKRGTLLDGCQASFAPSVPFVKLLDATEDGAAVNLGSYINLFARGDNSKVIAHVINAIDGFQAQDPNLKTLYLRYLDSGANSNVSEFAEGEKLTIFSNDFRLYDINIVSGSENFSNADNIIILSAIEVQNTSGGTQFANGPLQVGEVLQATSNAQVEIIKVDTTANTNAITLSIKPLDSQLALANTSSFLLATNNTLVSSGTNNTAVLTRFVGSGARANFQTGRTGTISSVTLEQGGSGYTVLPHVTISTRSASSSNIDTLNLEAENFIARVEIAEEDGQSIKNPTTGVGYGLSVTEGKIYQKGHFLRVNGQSIIVSKYSNTQSDVAVGFETVESFANAAVDPTLNDNAAGSLNENAPGADRLKLVPKLIVKTFAEADADPQFFPIYKFSEGRPYSQRTNVEFNKISDEMARRTFEESGNYVLNPFEITTRSTIDIADSDTSFTYLIDPGLAYINGYRVETVRNFAKNADKSTTTTTVSNTSLDLVYGNYVRCNEFMGLHNFSTAELVELHGTAADAISGAITVGTFVDPDDQIGTARIRSVVHEGGIQGASDAVYRVYLFDIRMDKGRNFKNVKSLHSAEGIADIVLEAGIAVIKETKNNSLIFNTSRPIEAISNIKYRYRTQKEAITISATGIITIANSAGAVWPYANALTTVEKNELIILPENNLVSNSNLAGTVSANSTTGLTGSGTSFASELEVGDYIIVDNDASKIVQLTSIADNNTAEFLPSGVLNGVSADTFTKVYPKDIPIPVASRSAMSAEVTGNNLTVNVNINLATSNTVTAVYNQRVENATPINKPATRTAYVKIQANTHPETTTGPWCLGIPDVFRLRGVYVGANTSGEDITDEFYVDHNQTENYYDLSFLYQRPGSAYEITTDAELLVEFDCFVRAADGGVMTKNSYTINDETVLADLTSAVNTLEISEVITKDRYHDLREVFDFRPSVVNTAAITTDPSSANTNPAESDANNLFSSSDIKFPVPEGDIFFDMEYYNSRVDTVLLNSTGEFEFLIGREPKSLTANQFPLYRVNIPAYPSLPKNLSTNVREIIEKGMASGSYTNQRQQRFTIKTQAIQDQVQGYTMEEISKLERRISILEYYANLSETENRVKELSIASSIDSTIERFKFGFFVDSFSNFDFSDRTDPAYRASIYEYVLQPASTNYNIPLKPSRNSIGLLAGDKLRFPYQRTSLLSQTFATVGPKELPPPPKPEQAVVKVCQNIVNRNKDFTITDTSNDYSNVEDLVWDGVTEENIFTLTSNTQAAGETISFAFSLYFGTDRIVVQQGRNPSGAFTTIFNTEANLGQVTTLSEAERRELRNLQIPTPALVGPEDWLSPDFNDANNNANDPAYTFAKPRGFLKFIGKFSLSYNPSAGRFLKVIVQKASPDFLYRICYPGDALIDPIYNTIGPIPSPPRDTEPLPDTTGGSAPTCPPSEILFLLIDKGYREDPCKPPPEEKPPILVIPPDPEEHVSEPDIPPETNDPGDDRNDETVYVPPPADDNVNTQPFVPENPDPFNNPISDWEQTGLDQFDSLELR